MAEKLSLGSEVRQLKLGQSFTNPKASAFHTIRYDFKPASVGGNKVATVEVGSNQQVTVTVPSTESAGGPQTVFKGSQRPHQKECVLIIDRSTGEITLERLSSNIQVKKTRNESIRPALPQSVNEKLNLPNRPQTPPIGQRSSSKTRVTSGSRRPERQITHLVPKHSPLHASPSYPSPGHYKSPKRDLHPVNVAEAQSQSTLASLPMIGVDDFSDAVVQPQAAPKATEKSPVFPQHSDDDRGAVGEMSDSSSSSSDSDSDSDRGNATVVRAKPKANGHANGTPPRMSVAPAHLLTEDLCLSESGSDSD